MLNSQLTPPPVSVSTDSAFPRCVVTPSVPRWQQQNSPAAIFYSLYYVTARCAITRTSSGKTKFWRFCAAIYSMQRLNRMFNSNRINLFNRKASFLTFLSPLFEERIFELFKTKSRLASPLLESNKIDTMTCAMKLCFKPREQLIVQGEQSACKEIRHSFPSIRFDDDECEI